MNNFLDKTGLQHYTEKVKAYVDSKSGGVNTDLTSHIGNKKNPHNVTKEQVGLGNVTNEAQIPLSQKGAASGVATLGTDGKLTAAQLPAMKTVNGVSVVGSGNISIDLSLYKVVDSLPTTGIDATKIYIVPAKTTEDKNIKAEYVYTGNPASTYDAAKWEKLGEAQTNIVVDAELSETSTNPIQNKAVKSAVDTLTGRLTTAEGTIKQSQDKIDQLSADNIRQDSALLAKLDRSEYNVDPELGTSSTNPIQNKAVKKAIDTLTSSVNDKVATSTYNTKMSALDSSISALQSKNTVQDSAIANKLSGIADKKNTYVSLEEKYIDVVKGLTVNANKEVVITTTSVATQKAIETCIQKTDMTAITNEEIDAMF